VPYRYLPDIAIADVAFEATGKSLEELFTAAGEATVNTMVDDLSAVAREKRLTVELTHTEIDLLLFDFLQEFIFFKDARQLLLQTEDISISKHGAVYTLRATLSGETLDAKKHALKADVKAVTLHRFDLSETLDGYRATVVLDV
jgi:SHS2 domain-containing protein